MAIRHRVWTWSSSLAAMILFYGLFWISEAIRMSSIFGISSAGSAGELQPVRAVSHAADAQAIYNISDAIEISLAARLAAAVHSSPEIRVDLIRRVKAEILAGTYETRDKIEATVDKILWEFEGE